MLDLTGQDTTKYKDFVDFIISSKLPEASYLRKNVENELADGTSMKAERDRTGYENGESGESVSYWIQKLYDLWEKIDKEGITMH